jgi:hypothetical protein
LNSWRKITQTLMDRLCTNDLLQSSRKHISLLST